jgi:hypothetical protein
MRYFTFSCVFSALFLNFIAKGIVSFVNLHSLAECFLLSSIFFQFQVDVTLVGFTHFNNNSDVKVMEVIKQKISRYNRTQQVFNLELSILIDMDNNVEVITLDRMMKLPYYFHLPFFISLVDVYRYLCFSRQSVSQNTVPNIAYKILRLCQ